jgi:hypothetical protein
MTHMREKMPQQGTSSFTRVSFPRVSKVVLRNFTLFTRQREVTVEVTDGVFCLAGANGLGKSTFLLAVTFGLTGIVPERSFASVDSYYSDSKEFSSDFFSGRIGEHDRDTAEISLTVKVGERSLTLTRGMFETNQLRAFVIRDHRDTVVFDAADMSPTDRHRRYEQEIVSRSGLSSFEQLVFLQHFVLMFDERRHLLFWDPRALEQTLYLAFGIAPGEASQADALRQKIQKAESLARNANWQASELRKKINSLVETSKKVSGRRLDKLEDKLQTLEKAKNAAQSRVDRIKGDLDDVQVTLADLSAKQTGLQARYTQMFSNHVAKTATIAMHPVVVASKRDGSCSICGSSGAEVIRGIETRVTGQSCPLCGSTLGDTEQKKGLATLRKLDSELDTVSQRLAEVTAKRQRLLGELDECSHGLQKAQVALDGFATENAEILNQVRIKASPGVQDLVNEYTRHMNNHLNVKVQKYKERDEHKRKLDALRRDLQVRYSQAEGVFLPMFKDLAGSFLGIDLDIRLTPTASAGLSLVLDVRGSPRKQHHQLSESQRFFIDIALRMALAQFMSSPDAPAGLYIDTPEGSLDIAYETRAGQMFSQFASKGYSILMTANINGSRLLTAMAEQCGARRMHVQRMTTWTDLSDVQQKEDRLFEEVFKKIKEALGKGGKRAQG